MAPSHQECRPNFLDARDEAWVEALTAEYRRFSGQPVREWRRRLQEPFPYYCPRNKIRFVVMALESRFASKGRYAKNHLVKLRRELFALSEVQSWTGDFLTIDSWLQTRRDHITFNIQNPILEEAKSRGETLDAVLYADLPSERIIPDIPDEPGCLELMLLANTYLIKSIVQRSQRIEIRLRGRARPVVRQARLRGLICVVTPLMGDSLYEVCLSLSGPLGIFRHAKLYGRLLVEVVPFLPLCDRFEVAVVVPGRDDTRTWMIRSGDPIKPAASSAYDSRVERRFAGDFGKATKDFDLVREPQPIVAGQRLIFPDFAIKHRTDPHKNWYLEIVGYWTQAYLDKKAADLRRANIDNLIICVDRKLGSGADWPSYARVIPFDGRIDPADVLKALLR